MSKIIFFAKIGLMATGVFKFIDSFYLQFGKMQSVDFFLFMQYSLIMLVVVFGLATIMVLICAYLFKHFQNSLVVD